MGQYFVGVDVSKGCHTAAAVDGDDQVRLKELRFADDATGYQRLLEALAGLPRPRSVYVCLEATGNYGHRLAAFLRAQPEFTVSMVNARQSHHFAKVLMVRTKTDRVDALLLARYARALKPRSVRSSDREDLARLTRSRQSLLVSLTAELNLLRSLLERVNPAVEREFRHIGCGSALAVLTRYPTGRMLARARVETLAHVKGTKRRLGEVRARRLILAARSIPGEQGEQSDALLVRELVAVARRLKHALASLEAAIAQQVQGHLLFSITGMSVHTIPVLLAELPVDELSNDAEAVAFAGLNPRLRQSGRLAGQVKLSKCGPPQLRHALYMAALNASRYNPVLRDYYQRKLAQGKRPRAAIIACMSKLLRIIFAILKTNCPFDPEYEPKRTAMCQTASQNA